MPRWSVNALKFEQHYWKEAISELAECRGELSPPTSLSWCLIFPTAFKRLPALAPLETSLLLLLLLSHFSHVRSAIPGILQARTLQWVAISFSNARKWKVKVKSLSCVRLFETPWTAAYQAPPSMGLSRQETSLQSFKIWHVDPTAELLIELVQGGTRKTGIANEAPWVILTCTTPKHGLLQNCPVAE